MVVRKWDLDIKILKVVMFLAMSGVWSMAMERLIEDNLKIKFIWDE